MTSFRYRPAISLPSGSINDGNWEILFIQRYSLAIVLIPVWWSRDTIYRSVNSSEGCFRKQFLHIRARNMNRSVLLDEYPLVNVFRIGIYPTSDSKKNSDSYAGGDHQWFGRWLSKMCFNFSSALRKTHWYQALENISSYVCLFSF